MHLAKLELHIRIMDKDMGPGEDLGEARIRLNKFITDIAETPSEATLNLEGPGAGNDEPNVSIKLNFTNIDDFKEESTVASFVSEGSELLEMKRERMHTGQWVPEIYQVGRLKPWTKLWTCCGCDDHLSMYCPTLADRVDFAHKMYERNEFLRMQPIKEAKAREVRMKWEKEKEEKKLAKVMREEEMAENGGEEPLNKMEKKHFFASKETKKKLGIWREPKLDLMSEAHGADENDLYVRERHTQKRGEVAKRANLIHEHISFTSVSHLRAYLVNSGSPVLRALFTHVRGTHPPPLAGTRCACARLNRVTFPWWCLRCARTSTTGGWSTRRWRSLSGCWIRGTRRRSAFSSARCRRSSRGSRSTWTTTRFS